MKNKHINKLLLFLLIVSLNACSTQKNTWLSRSYQNLTSQFNIYFNGHQSLQKGIDKIEKAHEDDYTQILSVFDYGDPALKSTARSEMDRAIEKGTKLIKNKSITRKPKRRKFFGRTERYKEFRDKSQFNKWVDDSYIMIGKAQFFKQEYIAALNTFQYIIREFSEDDIKYEAFIWLAHSHSELEEYNDAKVTLENIEGAVLPKELKKEFNAVYADLYLKQDMYDEAIPHLRNAVNYSVKKDDKLRYRYILAQILGEEGYYAESSAVFEEVIRMNPPYEMEFQAKMKRASYFENTADAFEIEKQLRRMLRDDKNLDYLGEIYAAIASLKLRMQDTTEAISNFKLALENSPEPDKKKALTFLDLAEVYYTRHMYIESAQYYDSAMLIVQPEDFENFSQIEDKSQNLNLLAANLIVIKEEDSLQRIAAMPESRRNALIDSLIAATEEEERLLAEQQEFSNDPLFQTNDPRALTQANNQAAGGEFYFYNPASLSYGKSEFIKQWGRRKLQDDWRRSNKTEMQLEAPEFSNMEEAAELNDSVTIAEEGLNAGLTGTGGQQSKSRSYYLANLPLNDSLLVLSDERIMESMFDAGQVFKDYFDKYREAAEMLENLLERYPDTEYRLDAYFSLFRLYRLMNNQDRAGYYRNRILDEFPESVYAKFFTDPEYFEKIKKQKERLNNLYESAYYSYRDNKPDTVVKITEIAKEEFPENELMPKFMYLSAKAQGKMGNVDGILNTLTTLVKEYPQSEVNPYAQKLLAELNKGRLPVASVENNYYDFLKKRNKELELTENESGKLGFEEEIEEMAFKLPQGAENHLVAVTVPSEEYQINKLVYSVALFNIDYFANWDLDIELTNINEVDILFVDPFDNANQAIGYYNLLKNDTALVNKLAGVNYTIFTISEENLALLQAQKSIPRYASFFNAIYESGQYAFEDASEEQLPDNQYVTEEGQVVIETFSQLDQIDTTALLTRTEPQEPVERYKGLYAYNFEDGHNVVIAIGDDNFELPATIQKIVRYNTGKNLRIRSENIGDYTIINITGFQNRENAMDYFRQMVNNRNLFNDFGDTPYRNFVISADNYAQLGFDNDFAIYMEFFKNEYLNEQTAMDIEEEIAPDDAPEETQPEPSENTEQQEQIEASAEETKAPADKLPEQPIDETTPPVTHLQDTTAEEQTAEEPEPAQPVERPKEGIFYSDIENLPHSFVIISGDETVNYSQLANNLKMYTSSQYGGRGLSVSQKEAGSSTTVVVEGFSSSDEAMNFFNSVIRARSLFQPVENKNYRNFIISNENYEIFSEQEANTNAYMEYFKKIYLNR